VIVDEATPVRRQSGSYPVRAGLRDSLVGLRSAFVTCSKNLCCPVPGARDAQPKGPQAGHEIPLVVAIAIDPALARPPFVPLPAGTAVALPLRLQLEEALPRQLGLALQIAPECLLHLRQEVLEVLADRCYLRHGCKSPFLGWLSLARPKPTYTLSLFTQSTLRHLRRTPQSCVKLSRIQFP
jgi:hypothetical protein